MSMNPFFFVEWAAASAARLFIQYTLRHWAAGRRRWWQLQAACVQERCLHVVLAVLCPCASSTSHAKSAITDAPLPLHHACASNRKPCVRAWVPACCGRGWLFTVRTWWMMMMHCIRTLQCAYGYGHLDLDLDDKRRADAWVELRANRMVCEGRTQSDALMRSYDAFLYIGCEHSWRSGLRRRPCHCASWIFMNLRLLATSGFRWSIFFETFDVKMPFEILIVSAAVIDWEQTICGDHRVTYKVGTIVSFIESSSAHARVSCIFIFCSKIVNVCSILSLSVFMSEAKRTGNKYISSNGRQYQHVNRLLVLWLVIYQSELGLNHLTSVGTHFQ